MIIGAVRFHLRGILGWHVSRDYDLNVSGATDHSQPPESRPIPLKILGQDWRTIG